MTEIPITLNEYQLLLSIAFGVENYFDEIGNDNEISQKVAKTIESRLKERLTKFNNLK